MRESEGKTTGRRRLVSVPIISLIVTFGVLAIAAGALLAVRGGDWFAGSEESAATVTAGAAQEAYDSGDFEAAEVALRKLVEADGGDLESRKALALALAAQGKNAQALEQYAAIIAADPSDHATLYRTAVLERLLGKTPEAIEHFEAALSVNNDPAYADELARTYMQAGRYADAVVKWQTVLDAGGLGEAGQAAIYAAMADAYEGDRDYDKAREALEHAVFLLPNDANLKVRLEGYQD